MILWQPIRTQINISFETTVGSKMKKLVTGKTSNRLLFTTLRG